MFIEHKCHIGLRDIGIGNKLKNKSLLGFLEDAGGIHSDIAGYGVEDIDKTNLSWVVLGWKIEIIKRPSYGEWLNIKTWSRKTNKFYAYRDYEVYNGANELVAKGTSKWVILDIKKKTIATLTDKIVGPYEKEDRQALEEEPKYKIVEPKNYINKCDYQISKSIIDVNKHVHNTSYIDIAYEALPEEIYYSEELNNIEIIYKKEIKYGEIVKCCYSKIGDEHIIVIKDENEENIHAVVKLK